MANENMIYKGNIGFALGGLAGNNAHGAGFLAGALKRNVEPVAISCTSGQIHWTYEYLKAKKDDKGRPVDPIKAHETFTSAVLSQICLCDPFFQRDMDLFYLTWRGIPNVLRLANTEMIFDMMYNGWCGWLDLAKKSVFWPMSRTGWFDADAKPFITQAMMRLMPARTMVSLRSRDSFEAMSSVFNSEDHIEIYFNAYDVISGTEYVFYNKAAAKRCQGRESKRSWVRFAPISPEAVEYALRLYEYGFNDFSMGSDSNALIDGAYIRQIMLSELVDSSDTIYVARPLDYAKHPDYIFPRSCIERDDLKTEVGFNGTYALERQKIEIFNKKMVQGKPGKYHRVEIVELPYRFERGYFDYVFENKEVFEKALSDTLAFFPGGGTGGGGVVTVPTKTAQTASP